MIPEPKWREIRKARGLSQAKLAEIAGVSLKQYHAIEHGANAELETVFRLLDALNCTFWEVYGR